MAARVVHTEEQREKAVQRYMKGEPVKGLAKEFKVSVPGLYLWIKNAKDRAVVESRRASIGEASAKKEDEINIRLRLEALELENDRLKKKLFELMLKAGVI